MSAGSGSAPSGGGGTAIKRAASDSAVGDSKRARLVRATPLPWRAARVAGAHARNDSFQQQAPPAPPAAKLADAGPTVAETVSFALRVHPDEKKVAPLAKQFLRTAPQLRVRARCVRAAHVHRRGGLIWTPMGAR